jgi:hypothetical protein
MAKNDNKIIWIGGGILILIWLYKSGKLNNILPGGGGGAASGSATNAAKMAVTDAIQSTTFAPAETNFKAMYEADINKCN